MAEFTSVIDPFSGVFELPGPSRLEQDVVHRVRQLRQELNHAQDPESIEFRFDDGELLCRLRQVPNILVNLFEHFAPDSKWRSLSISIRSLSSPSVNEGYDASLDPLYSVVKVALEHERFYEIELDQGLVEDWDQKQELNDVIWRVCHFATTLQTLKLRFLCLSEEHFSVLAESLTRQHTAVSPKSNEDGAISSPYPKLRHLEFIYCDYVPNHDQPSTDIHHFVDLLSTVLIASQTLESLKIKGPYHICDAEVAILFRALIGHPTMQQLEVGAHVYGQETMAALVSIFRAINRSSTTNSQGIGKNKKGLTHLKIGFCGGVFDMVGFCRVFAYRPVSLVSLDLSSNKFSSKQVALLLSSICPDDERGRHGHCSLPYLQWLDLSRNQIKDWEAITRNLPEESSYNRSMTPVLSSINLEDNPCMNDLYGDFPTHYGSLLRLLRAFGSVRDLGGVMGTLEPFDRRENAAAYTSTTLQLRLLIAHTLDWRRCGTPVIRAESPVGSAMENPRYCIRSHWPKLLAEIANDPYLAICPSQRPRVRRCLLVRQASIIFRLLQEHATSFLVS